MTPRSSPLAFGFKSVPQPLHSWKKMQASVGIDSAFAPPHEGQVIVDSNVVMM